MKAIRRVLDRNKKREVIFDECYCAQHWQTERPHNCEELEVKELPADTVIECDFCGLSPELDALLSGVAR